MEIKQNQYGVWMRVYTTGTVTTYSFFETEDDAVKGTGCYGIQHVYPHNYSC
jgi:hypothetical protein